MLSTHGCHRLSFRRVRFQEKGNLEVLRLTWWHLDLAKPHRPLVLKSQEHLL